MKRIAVFGATSAIVGAVTRRWAARGDRLFLVGRNPERLAAEVAALGPAVVGSRCVDLDTVDAAALVAEAIGALGDIDIAFIGHGALPDQAQTEVDIGAAEAAMRTNLLSAVALLIPLANHMEARRSGTLAVITSVAAERGRPRNYTYGAAKAALDTYMEGLRSRLWRAGATVVVIKPGPIDSPMTVGHPRNALFVGVDAIAPRIVRAIDAGWALTYVPGRWRLIMAIVRWLPEAVFQQFAVLSGR